MSSHPYLSIFNRLSSFLVNKIIFMHAALRCVFVVVSSCCSGWFIWRDTKLMCSLSMNMFLWLAFRQWKIVIWLMFLIGNSWTYVINHIMLVPRNKKLDYIRLYYHPSFLFLVSSISVDFQVFTHTLLILLQWCSERLLESEIKRVLLRHLSSDYVSWSSRKRILLQYHEACVFHWKDERLMNKINIRKRVMNF